MVLLARVFTCGGGYVLLALSCLSWPRFRSLPLVRMFTVGLL